MMEPYRPASQGAARLGQPYRIPNQVSAMKARLVFRSDSIHSLAENASSLRHYRHPTCHSAHLYTNQTPPAPLEFPLCDRA
jgi:hypothetical protein